MGAMQRTLLAWMRCAHPVLFFASSRLCVFFFFFSPGGTKGSAARSRNWAAASSGLAPAPVLGSVFIFILIFIVMPSLLQFPLGRPPVVEHASRVQGGRGGRRA